MRNDYVQGSNARKYDTASERRVYYNEAPIKRAKTKTVQWTPLYVIMLSSIVLLFMAVVMHNIALSSQVSTLRNQKGVLTGQYEDLVLENNLYYDNILSNVDLKEIEHIAIVDLGMSIATAGQVVVYSGDMEDYVKQYSDLPEE